MPEKKQVEKQPQKCPVCSSEKLTKSQKERSDHVVVSQYKCQRCGYKWAPESLVHRPDKELRRAMPPGKRISSTGAIYYEHRDNRVEPNIKPALILRR